MQTFIELLKAAAWPAITLYFLLAYRDAIGKILLQIPAKLRSASKVEVGSLKLELAASLEGSGDADLAVVMRRLSRRAYQKIIDLRDPNRHHCIAIHSRRADGISFYELPSTTEIDVPGRQLAIPEASLSEDNIKFIQSGGYNLTHEGRCLYEAMFDVIINHLAH